MVQLLKLSSFVFCFFFLVYEKKKVIPLSPFPGWYHIQFIFYFYVIYLFINHIDFQSSPPSLFSLGLHHFLGVVFRKQDEVWCLNSLHKGNSNLFLHVHSSSFSSSTAQSDLTEPLEQTSKGTSTTHLDTSQRLICPNRISTN